MIKVELFYPDRDKLEKDFKERMVSRLQAMNPFGNPWYGGQRPSIPQFDLAEVSKDVLGSAKLEELWINPSEISKIKLYQISTGEKFLELSMKNGDVFKAKGDSVQEFFMKNAVLGDDVG